MYTNSLSKRLQLDHVNLHYLDYGGPGPQTLVCVHGGGANAPWFDFVGPSLARSCRVLAVDLRGHGDSSWAEPPVYTFEAHMQDLRALFHAERITAPLLMGHSMGGILLTQYTGTWPQDVGPSSSVTRGRSILRKPPTSCSRWDAVRVENMPRWKTTWRIFAFILMGCVLRRRCIATLPALQHSTCRAVCGRTRSTAGCMPNASR